MFSFSAYFVNFSGKFKSAEAFSANQLFNIYMLLASREFRIGKNCALCLEDSFSQYGPTWAGELQFYFFP